MWTIDNLDIQVTATKLVTLDSERKVTSLLPFFGTMFGQIFIS